MTDEIGRDALRRLATSYFASRIDDFLKMDPHEIKKIVDLAGLDEQGFIAAMKELQGAARDSAGRLQ